MVAAQTTAPLTATPRGAVTRLKWLYLINYAAYGCTSIYRNLYFRRVGLDNSELGLLIAVQPLLMLVAGPLWSMLADRLNLRSRLLTVVMALSVIPIIATPFCTRFWPLLGWSVLYALLQAPMQPLMDSSAVVALGANRHQYSVIRAYGSLGYAPMVYLTGVAVQHIDLRWSFAGYVVLMLIAAFVSLGVRSDECALQSRALDGLEAVRKDRAWRVMMGAFFINTVLQAVAFGYSSLYLDTLGASEGLIGLSGAIGSLSQTLLMFTLLPWLVRHWGGERLLVFSLAMFCVRLSVWAFAPYPWAVAASEVMMGLTTGAALVGSVDFAARRAPPGMAATAQALMSCFVNGLGRTLGSAATGRLYDGIGPQPLFAAYAGIAAAGALGFAAIWRRQLRSPDSASARESQAAS
jgi:PPP family 3-phenylpropionic acid transporter